MKKQFLTLSILFSTLLLMTACIKDKFDGPETGCIIEEPTTGTKITIQELTDTYNGLISDDVYIEGVVIADDASGNFYKKIIIQDETKGLAINIDRTEFNSSFPEGRKIYVKLQGLYINSYDEIAGNAAGDRILNAQVDNYIKRGECFQDVKPDTVALSDLNASYVNKLVTIMGVEFTNGANGITYADATNLLTVNLDLNDCNGNSIIVRNSGYATFAGDTVPSGNGSITGVFNIFGSDYQLFIRDTYDVNMPELRCDGSGGGPGNFYLQKNFDDNSITSGGWTTFQESGTINWAIGSFNSYFYANLTNYVGGSNQATEAWLISPSVDLSTSTTPILNFRNAYKYTGDPLEVKISTNYNSGNPTAATWTDLSPTLSAGNFVWTDSGDVLLTAYKTANVHIAFVYRGSNSDGSNWEVDDVKIKEL
jgi:hypothetical protein